MGTAGPEAVMAAAADDPLCGLELEQQAGRPRAAPFIVSSLIALALVAGLAGILVEVAVDERSASLHAAQGARMEALARGRAEVLATWLNGIAQTGRRLAEADPLQLFANEMTFAESAEPPVAPDHRAAPASAADDRRFRPAERAGRRRTGRPGRAGAPAEHGHAAAPLQPDRSAG